MLTENQKLYLRRTCATAQEPESFYCEFNNNCFVFGSDNLCDIDTGDKIYIGAYKNQVAYQLLMELMQLSKVSHISFKNINPFSLFLN